MPSFDEMGGELRLPFLTHIGEKNLKACHREFMGDKFPEIIKFC